MESRTAAFPRAFQWLAPAGIAAAWPEEGPRAAWKPEAQSPGSFLPGQTSGESLAAHLAQLLPMPTDAELQVEGVPVAHLERELRALTDWRAPRSEAGEWWSELKLSELLAVFREQRGDAAGTQRLLDELATATGAMGPDSTRVRDYLVPLLRTRVLLSEAWDPSEGGPEDGILEGAKFTIRGNATRPPPWNQPDLARDVLQAAVLVFTDLPTLEGTLMDFESMSRNEARDKLDHFPVAGTYESGSHPGGGAIAAWREFHHQALGFPFGTLAYEMVNLKHYDEAGLPLVESYAAGNTFEGQKHFSWCAAREAYLPVQDMDGETIATFVASCLSFDIAGVLELDMHRRSSQRERLGNLKRNAELTQ